MIDNKLKDSTKFKSLVKRLKDDAEGSLSQVRAEMAENMEYYNALLPKPAFGIKTIDPVCREAVMNLLATQMDALTAEDTFEIIPDDVSSSVTIKVINQVVKKAMNQYKQKDSVIEQFLLDQYICKIGVVKVTSRYITKTIMEHRQLDPATLEAELPMLMGDVDQEGESATVEIDGDTGAATITKTQKVRVVGIDNIKPENFIINSNATCLCDAKVVGHEESVTVSELVELGFDIEDIVKVSKTVGSNKYYSDDELESIRQSQATGTFDANSVFMDVGQKEVQLYELYVTTSLESGEETDEESIREAKTKRVMMCSDVLLSVEDVEENPYVVCSPYKNPHSIFGAQVVDLTKDIQRAKTGLWRANFQYITMQANPRLTYTPGVDIMALQNPRPGVAIEIPNSGAVQMLSLQGTPPDIDKMLMALNETKEKTTGITSVGQSLPSEILKSGGSAIGASMVMTRQQAVEKMIIKRVVAEGIKPLLEKVYKTIRSDIDEIDITIDGQKIVVSPVKDGWPEVSEIIIKTPLGSSAKLDKARLYSELMFDMTQAQVANPRRATSVLLEKYGTCLDIVNIKEFLPNEQELAQADQMTQVMQQMQQMQQQVQQLTMQNQQLMGKVDEQEQSKLKLEYMKLNLKQTETEHKQLMDERKQEEVETVNEKDAVMEAKRIQLEEEMLNLKRRMAEIEALTGGQVNFVTV